MNMLAIFTNFSSGQIVAIILLTAFILTVWLVKFFCLSRINIIDLSITIVLFLLCLFVDLNEILIIICIIVNSLDLVYALLDLALYVYMKNEISQNTKAIIITVGTKYPDTVSASAAIGAFLPCASSTSFMI